MTFTVRGQHDGWVVVSLSEDMDFSAAPDLRDRFTAALGDVRARRAEPGGPRGVVVDLGSVQFMDSAGLGVLIGAYQQARTDRTDFRLAAAPPLVATLLEITGLTSVMELYPTPDDAVRAGPAPPTR